MASQAPSPLLFLLPQGLTITGVNTWAVTVVRKMRARGHEAAALVHGGATGYRELQRADGDALVRLELPGADTIADDRQVGLWSRAYLGVIERMADAAGAPVAVIPTRHDACFAAVADIARTRPDTVRPLLWQQVDSRYEDALLDHFEPMGAALVGASEYLARSLRRRLPGRHEDIVSIPNAVEAPRKAPEPARGSGRALRVLYAGRLDHEQKRVMALAAMTEELTQRGVDHTVRIVGDGPASEDLHRACTGDAHVEFMGPLDTGGVRAQMAWADVVVLPSRAEGLSLAVLEAMTHGRAVVLTRTASGADEAIEHGVSGWIVDAPDNDTLVGRALAQGVLESRERGLAVLGAAARDRAIERFSASSHIDRVEALCRSVASAPERAWPADRRLLARGPRVSDALSAAYAERILTEHDGRFVVHGAGAHTARLLSVLRRHADRIVAITDDDASRWGGAAHGWAIIDPATAAQLGAQHALISSDLHEDAIWARRGVYERQGVRVHRLYAADTPAKVA